MRKGGYEDKNGRSRSGGGAKGAASHKFLNHNLSASEKDRLRALDFDIEFPRSMDDALVLQQYKISYSHDAKNKTYIVALTDRHPDSAWCNTTLTGRGSSLDNARCSVLFRHFILADGDWSVLVSPDSEQAVDFD